MSALSNFLENELLDHVLRNEAYTAPTTVYLALFTADTGQLESGSNVNEVTGGSYARQTVTFNVAASGATANSAQINFTSMPAVTVTHVALIDHLSNNTTGNGGTANVLFHGALSASKTLNSGDTFTINAGDLDITLA